jgi:hypothetical protein
MPMAVPFPLTVTSALVVVLDMLRAKLGIASPHNPWARLVTLRHQALFIPSPRARRMLCPRMISMRSAGVLR